MIWTIAADAGTGGDLVAAQLAALSGTPLVDVAELARLARLVDPEIGGVEDIRERFGPRLMGQSLSIGVAVGSPGAGEEIHGRLRFSELAKSSVREAARRPGVIVAAGAFAALRDHPTALHVRISAPTQWCIDSVRRDHLIAREAAARLIKEDARKTRRWVKALYGVDINDPRRFSFVIDGSRLPPERIARSLLAAAAVGDSVDV